MPVLQVKVSGSKTAQIVQDIGTLLMDCTSRILGKKKEVTAIVVEFVAADSWFVGGELLSKSGKNSFTLEIKITDETNTKDQKAQYIHEVFSGFQQIQGSLHEESYIHINDVRATGYGFGGLTQEFRYQRA
jgi:4-oxalocrotonate tautomerase